MNRHDLYACQQNINHDNRESAAISTTVAGVEGQSQDGMVLPSHPGGRERDEWSSGNPNILSFRERDGKF